MKPRMGRPTKYRVFVEQLVDDNAYSPAEVAGQTEGRERTRIRTTLAMFARARGLGSRPLGAEWKEYYL